MERWDYLFCHCFCFMWVQVEIVYFEPVWIKLDLFLMRDERKDVKSLCIVLRILGPVNVKQYWSNLYYCSFFEGEIHVQIHAGKIGTIFLKCKKRTLATVDIVNRKYEKEINENHIVNCERCKKNLSFKKFIEYMWW